MSRKRHKKPKVQPAPGVVSGGAVLSETLTPAPKPIFSSRLQIAISCVLLLVFTGLIYSTIRDQPFINYDDGTYIVSNPYIQEGLNWKTVGWAFKNYYAANWHPLTWLVHALDYQFFGQDAGGYHVTSLLLHLMNVALLFLMLVRVTSARWQSLCLAALFAVHPLNVESVAWAAELKNVLCTLFFLLALAAYGWYAQKPSVKRYLLLPVLFFLGLASKPMVITLPFVLLLLDFWPLRRFAQWTTASATFPVPQKPFASLVLEKLPLFAMSIVSAWITVAAQRSGGASEVVSASLGYRLENALYSYALYIWKAFWPSALAPFYPYRTEQIPVLSLVVSAAFLIAVSICVWRARREAPYLLTGWLWYLGTLVPVIGFVQVGGQAWANRYAYIPLIGIFLMVVWGSADLAEARGLAVSRRVAFAAIAVSLLSVVTWRQVSYWKSGYDLWTHTLDVTTNNAVAEHNLAMVLMRTHRWDEAAPHLARSSELNPANVVSLIDLGAVLAAQGHDQEAVGEYELVLQRTTDPSVLLAAYQNLGNEYHKLGSDDKAEANFRQALRINPAQSGALNGLGRVLMDKKINELAQTLAARPTADGYLQYGQMLQQADRRDEAKSAYEKALKLDSKLAEARRALEALPKTAAEK